MDEETLLEQEFLRSVGLTVIDPTKRFHVRVSSDAAACRASTTRLATTAPMIAERGGVVKGLARHENASRPATAG